MSNPHYWYYSWDRRTTNDQTVPFVCRSLDEAHLQQHSHSTRQRPKYPPCAQNVELHGGDWLGHDICEHVLRRTVLYHDLIFLDLFTRKVVADVDVLGALVKLRVLGQLNSTLIVFKYS